jgi:prevent-host-death family protein
MSTHSVAEAESKLSELIDRALDGEGVVITRDGQPVVELKPVPRQAKLAELKPRWTVEEQIEWLRARRARLPMSKVDAVTEIRRMREEGEE